MNLFEKLFKIPAEDFADGKLVFLTRIPGEVIVLAFVGLAALAWFFYRRVFGRVSRKARWTLLCLRTAQLAAAFFILAIPAMRLFSHHRDSVFTAVLVDTSRSMSIRDAGAGAEQKTRLEAGLELLRGRGGGEGGLLAELGKRSNVLLYSFDRAHARAGDPNRLKAEGISTNIFASLRDVEEELRGMPLAAVVMITDGCRNVGGNLDDAAGIWKARGVPLHVVGLGSTNPPKDYEVVRVVAPRRVRRNSEVEIFVTVRHTNFPGPFDVNITRESTTVFTQTVTPQAGSDLERVRLAFTPDVEGSSTYRVSVPAGVEEMVTENNHKDFVLEIRDDRLPVLYIEGSPRLEYRFLKRALFRDSDFRLVGVLRLGQDPQGKMRFYVQGANESESYLERGFPDTPERLFAFHAVILGDIEAGYFTPAQLQMLEQFVREQGRGLLMLGGVNSFGLGKYADTPVGKMLPLDISSADAAYSDEEYRAKVAKDGLDHPVMRLAPNPVANARVWEKMPPLIGITPVRGVKFGANLLITSEKGDKPVLAVQNYGEGRVAAFTSGGSWYWRMSVPAINEFQEKFWKQLIRWLAVGAKQQLAVETNSNAFVRGEPVLIKATVLGKDLRPVNDASVIAGVGRLVLKDPNLATNPAIATRPAREVQDIPMDWILSEEGVYQCRYVPEEEGDYKAEVRVEGWDLKPVEVDFKVAESLIEYSDAGQKEQQLRAMAQSTGGRYFGYADARDLPQEVARDIKQAGLAGLRQQEEPIWDMPVLFGLLLGVLAAEWIVRRKSGLA